MKWIKPSEVDGEILAPPSKSMMIRVTAACLLSRGETRVSNPSFCDDGLAALNIIKSLGADVANLDQDLIISGGLDNLRLPFLNCRESGLCIRMFAPIAALWGEKIILYGSGSLVNRPVDMMEVPLSHLGCYCRTYNGRMPVQIKGPIKGGKIRVEGSQSSQFLTGLLMSLPLCEDDSEIMVSHLQSKPYIAMTLSLLSDFGIDIAYEKDVRRFFIKGAQQYHNKTYRVEGDWSGASFFLVAAALGGCIKVHNLSHRSDQADKKILDVLDQVGAKTEIGDNTVTVEKASLNAFKFDATQCPDLFPPLTTLACFCEGKSEIHGVKRLGIKESNRGEALLTEFREIKARLAIEGNKMVVHGNSLEGGSMHAHGDHRIAMAAAVAGTQTRIGVKINDWTCISKSYPQFFEDLDSITRRKP